MGPEVWVPLVGAVTGLLIALTAWVRYKIGKGKPTPPAIAPPVVVPVDPGADGSEDAGQFLVAMQKAKPDVLEEFIRELRKSNAQEPATRQDLQREVGGLRSELSTRFTANERAIGDLRDRDDETKRMIAALPCTAGPPPDDCPAHDGGNGGIAA